MTIALAVTAGWSVIAIFMPRRSRPAPKPDIRTAETMVLPILPVTPETRPMPVLVRR